MKPVELVAVCVRFFAVSLFLSALNFIFQMVEITRGLSPFSIQPSPLPVFLFGGAILLLLLTVALLFWVFPIRIAKFIVPKGIDGEFKTLVHFLAVEGFCEAVAFLAEHGADMNAVNEFGDAPLIDVAVLGFNDIAQVILRHGADPNANAGSEGRSNALDCAVRAGNSGLVEMLLEAGANARYSTDLGETIFDALPESEERRQSILVVLAQHGIKARSG